jgi:hypothetical protein
MKSETLRALLVDRELGELAPEFVELLDAYVAAVPAAQAEAHATARTVSATRETIRRYPDLAPTRETEAEIQIMTIIYWLAPRLARAAMLIAVAALAGWLGYRTGQSNTPVNKQAGVVQSAGHHFDGLWAQYQVAFDSRHGTVVVSQEQ